MGDGRVSPAFVRCWNKITPDYEKWERVLRPQRFLDESMQFPFVEFAVRSNAAAQIEPEWLDRVDRVADILGCETSREEERTVRVVANPPAQGPVMHLAGAAKNLDREGRVPAVEQEGVHFGRELDRFLHRAFVENVDDLNELHRGERRFQLSVCTMCECIHDLYGIRVRAFVMGNDCIDGGFACEEERGDRRGNRCGDLLDPFIRDRSGSARHAGNEAEGRGTAGDGELRFIGILDAANLDVWRHGGIIKAKKWNGKKNTSIANAPEHDD